MTANSKKTRRGTSRLSPHLSQPAARAEREREKAAEGGPSPQSFFERRSALLSAPAFVSGHPFISVGVVAEVAFGEEVISVLAL
jgi:hypothetical protein